MNINAFINKLQMEKVEEIIKEEFEYDEEAIFEETSGKKRRKRHPKRGKIVEEEIDIGKEYRCDGKNWIVVKATEINKGFCNILFLFLLKNHSS